MSITSSAAACRPPSAPAARPSHYVCLPQALLIKSARSALQIGVYALVARMFAIAREPVTLSAHDIVQYDPSLSRGAAERALSGLVAAGWLLAQTALGSKNQYLPTWGQVRGTPLAWDVNAPSLGRPRHIRTTTVDCALLDVLIGKLTPQPRTSAIITRYLTTPALALRDVGSYALTRGGIPTETPALEAWSFVRHGMALPIPDKATLLACASQEGMTEARSALTPQGLRQLGQSVVQTPLTTAQPLFFVPVELIATLPATMPAEVIAQTVHTKDAVNAVECPKQADPAGATQITWRKHAGHEQKVIHPPNPPGGGALSAVRVAPNTPSAAALRTLNIHPISIARYANLPLSQVEQAIDYVNSLSDTRDRAARVVDVLRQHLDHNWVIPAPLPRQGWVDWAAEQERLSGAAMPEMIMPTTALVEPDGVQPVTISSRSAVEHACGAPPNVHSPDLSSQDSVSDTWAQVRELLASQLNREEWALWIRPARLLHIHGNEATLAAETLKHKRALDERYTPTLRVAFREVLGPEMRVRVVVGR